MLLRLLLLVVWTPRAVHAKDDRKEQEGGGGPHQHCCQPLHLLLEYLILLSTAIFVVGSPTAEHIDSLITGRAVEPSVPLA